MDNKVVQINQKRREQEFSGVLSSYRERVKSLQAAGNTLQIDLSEANIFRITLRQNVVNITFDNLPAPDFSYSCTLVFIQDNMGSRRVVFPENVMWSFNERPTLSQKSGHADVVTLVTFDGGEAFYGAHAMANLGR